MSLHGAIDDATGTVLALHFRPTEDLHGYATLLAPARPPSTACRWPSTAIASTSSSATDAHWTLAEELQGAQSPTHFGRMLAEPRHRLHPRRLAPGQGPHRAPLAAPCRIASSANCACTASTTLEAASAFLPAFLADFNPPLRSARRRGCSPRGAAPRAIARRCSSAAATSAASPPTTPCRLGLRWRATASGPRRRSWAGHRVELRGIARRTPRRAPRRAGPRLAAQSRPGLCPPAPPLPRGTRRSRRTRTPPDDVRAAAAPPSRSPPVAPGRARTHPWRPGVTPHSRALQRAWRQRTLFTEQLGDVHFHWTATAAGGGDGSRSAAD